MYHFVAKSSGSRESYMASSVSGNCIDCTTLTRVSQWPYHYIAKKNTFFLTLKQRLTFFYKQENSKFWKLIITFSFKQKFSLNSWQRISSPFLSLHTKGHILLLSLLGYRLGRKSPPLTNKQTGTLGLAILDAPAAKWL